MDTYMSGVALVVCSSLASVLGLILVRRRIAAPVLISCHEVGGYLLSVVGTLYAVLLGLVVVDAMNTFQEAHQTTEEESNALADVVLLARRLPEAPRRRIADLAERYAELVVGAEWDAMNHGGRSPEARATLTELFDVVVAFEPTSESQKTIHEAQVDAAVRLWNGRRRRLALAAQGMPRLKWLVLSLGGVITVFFTFFFVVENLRIQALMTALISILIALNLYLVLMFGYPYSGDLRVDPAGYRLIGERGRDGR